ncbi:MAG: transglutaminase-like domain-containing protein [Lachnospiraceae bacterium]
MFSEKYSQEIEAAFQRQMTLLECRREEIEATLSHCDTDEAEALKYLYTAMPICDALDYPAEVFFAYARHGAFLWNSGPFAGKVPEKMFANYVLHHRINNEDIVEHREFFYSQLKDIIAGKDMQHAVIAANYWCAEEGTYHTTDDRTENPMTMYHTALGRCGEESTFTVSVFRSLGIPARQVYVPLWSHCDDNHAWVEAWCDGKWYFLGACEPEEILNRGWFTAASARAMLVHSRWFGQEEPDDEIVGRGGMSRIVNHLDLYAKTVEMHIHISDETGAPVSGAKVMFQVLNYAHFGNVATVFADEQGNAVLKTGYGSLLVCASDGRKYGEVLAALEEGEEKVFQIVLRENMQELDVPVDMDFIAPSGVSRYNNQLTKEQKALGDLHLREAAKKREKKIAGFYPEEEMEHYIAAFPAERQNFIRECLKKSRGNIAEVKKFLNWDCTNICPEDWKYKILATLSDKDFWDLKADLLIEHCTCTEPDASLTEKVFDSYILCPRVSYEPLVPWRKWLQNYFTAEQKEKIYSNPKWVYEYVNAHVKVRPDLEYSRLITSARGCLEGGIGSDHSKKVTCVQIYRALGIPARLNPVDYALECYCNGEFLTIGRIVEDRRERSAKLWLRGPVEPDVRYLEQLSVAEFVDQQFRVLWLSEENVTRKGHEIGIDLVPGIYRLVSTNRLTNGNQLAQKVDFTIADGEEKHITLFLRGAKLEDMLEDNPIDDIPLCSLNGEERMMSEWEGKGKALFIWLEESREPTEHILNELYDQRKEFQKISAPIYFVIQQKEALKNPTLQRTLSVLPNVQILQDDFDTNYNTLVRQMFLEPGKLPFILVTGENHDGIYGIAGYNVGTASMLAKILAN